MQMDKRKRGGGALTLLFWRIAASGWLPGRWFVRGLPPVDRRAARTGDLHLEVVSHCWNYSHLLVYQLSSLVLHPPKDATVTVTVFYGEEDGATVALLDFFGAMEVPRVRWNFRSLPKERLFRRAIGRNLAALDTKADWIWFTDCDLVFHAGCLDALVAQLQGRRDALVFPLVECCSALLAEDDPVLRQGRSQPRVIDIDPHNFTTEHKTRATGPLQITHGDVARACGYCRDIGYYQQPSDKWCKAHEDRAFRWLLGTQGVGVDVPGVFRIKHIHKGRYNRSPIENRLRSWIRRMRKS